MISKKLFLPLILLTALSLPMLASQDNNVDQIIHSDWIIVGAGPAGIATVGVLLDIGVHPDRIIWIDPEFNVGRIGAYYASVPANSKTKEFIYFVNACKSFQECKAPEVEALNQCDPEQRFTLSYIAKPLQEITHHLRTKIRSYQESMISLYYDHHLWHVTTDKTTTCAAPHVILATGACPRTLEYETQKIVPLDIALNQTMLKEIIQPDDIVGVVGSAHSAILLMKFLSEMPVKHIYNLYKTPIAYAPGVYQKLMTRGIAVGVKGVAAEWAYNVLEKNPPANLTRIVSTPETLASTLAQCSKVIYAIGYDRNALPLINGSTPIDHYDEKTGIIAPGLFGIGIAFPEKRPDEQGNPAVCIGLDCFMEYAQHIVPIWAHTPLETKKQISDQISLFKKMGDLFTIFAL